MTALRAIAGTLFLLVGLWPASAEVCEDPPSKGVPATVPYTGRGTLVFDSDHRGWGPHNGAGCQSCDCDATAQNRTTGGSESIALTVSPLDWSIAASFRGCLEQTTDHSELQLWVRPTDADLQFRVGLRQVDIEQSNDISLGDVRIDGLQEGVWNLVTIPLSQFTTGIFNAVQIRSAGVPSATPFHLDDLVLLSDPPSSPPPVPDGSSGTPLLVAKEVPSGSSLILHWDTSTCDTAINYHVLYGVGSRLPAAVTGSTALDGAACAVGATSPVTWDPVPDPSIDPSGLLWFLLVGDDGGTIEGSWGQNGNGDPRRGQGVGGASKLCGMADRNLDRICP